MNKKYLTLEEVQKLFSLRNEEYEKTSGLTKIQEAINKSLFTIIEFIQKGKVKVFQVEQEGEVHTFVELEDSKLTNEEKENLHKIGNFLKKIEESLGYQFLKQ